MSESIEKSSTNSPFLAWLIDRPGLTAPIASATTIEQLDDILRAADLSLPAAVVDKLNAASAQ